MKTITLKVNVEVPDDYVMDDPEWTLEDCYNNYDSECSILSVDVISKQ